MQSFAAIDFETANECPSSVCSVGVVIVRNGEFVERFHSLIHPEPEYYKWFCQQVHGLCECRGLRSHSTSYPITLMSDRTDPAWDEITFSVFRSSLRYSSDTFINQIIC